MVAEMIAEMQHYAVSCSHVWRQPLQPYHAAMCSMVHTVHTCSVQSRVGHEHHRDAESQVERRRLHGAAAASRASDFDPHLMWLASKDVQRKCSGVRAFYFALSLSKSNFVWTNLVDVWAIQLQMMKKTRKRKRRRGPRLLLPCPNECIPRCCREIA